METIEADVVIVGGGPAGCTCALYTSRADLKTVILDKNPAVGALAITHQIANYPGVPTDMSGEDLLALMRDQAVQYGTDYRRAQVFGVDVNDEWKTVYTPEGTFKGRALVLASGAMGRPASFKGEADFLGKGVSYCATCDGAFYRGKEVAVVGINKEAIEEAQVLTKFASMVHWITSNEPKDDDFHAKDLIAQSNVKHWNRTRMMEIQGNESGVTGIQIKPRSQDELESISVEGVFVYMTGSKPITDFLGDQVAFKEDGGVVVDDFMATTSEGVWAIGDIRNTPFKQAVVAASDGCIAAMAIDRFLNSRKIIRVDWVHS
ncbi:NAD(P)/FAD-dependent oxidoreductase [Prochlorococcus sp. MIT 1300]|uniref:NAD(P)/FAD-dependent oxidoreductase n=1 Tax=Prochlorococcus sp. MIT 1300 TaxID=3096218 RepID=UPI002A75F7DD|nr:FAD-dependent oxidoreductase [Prochlorococcus sp. MIT 1300]